ncbi:MAG: hypothetical protein ACFFB0_19565 [Promethearchaeota archaeon]
MIIENVPAFFLNWDAGDMFILALESCLRYLGQETNSWWLAGISGDAFKFVYDKEDVREPMRDRVPIDTISIACTSIGWEGKWYINEKIERSKELIMNSLEQGYPIITSNLGSQWYHGANIITGLNEDTDEIFLQIGRENLLDSIQYETISIPEKWDGPVPGPIIWADNPLFLFEKKLKQPEEESLVFESITRAVNLYRGDSLLYKSHPGAQKYSTSSLEGKSVKQGLAALVNLKEEIEQSEITWPVIWSVTTQVGQLSYDRSNAGRYLEETAKKHSQYSELETISKIYYETTHVANLIKQSYWDKRWNKTNNIEKLVEYISNSKSFVYDVSNLKAEILDHIRNRFPVIDTLWGPAVKLDSSERRIYNSNLINMILNNEKRSVEFLTKLIKVF